MTVMEYSVPSSRPVTMYIVSLPAMSGVVWESVKQSVSLLVYEMVYDVAVKLCSSAHEMVRDVVDMTDALSPSG